MYKGLNHIPKSFIYTNICFEWILHISDKKDEVLKSAEKTKKALRVNINNILSEKKIYQEFVIKYSCKFSNILWY